VPSPTVHPIPEDVVSTPQPVGPGNHFALSGLDLWRIEVSTEDALCVLVTGEALIETFQHLDFNPLVADARRNVCCVEFEFARTVC